MIGTETYRRSAPGLTDRDYPAAAIAVLADALAEYEIARALAESLPRQAHLSSIAAHKFARVKIALAGTRPPTRQARNAKGTIRS